MVVEDEPLGEIWAEDLNHAHDIVVEMTHTPQRSEGEEGTTE